MNRLFKIVLVFFSLLRKSFSELPSQCSNCPANEIWFISSDSTDGRGNSCWSRSLLNDDYDNEFKFCCYFDGTMDTILNIGYDTCVYCYPPTIVSPVSKKGCFNGYFYKGCVCPDGSYLQGGTFPNPCCIECHPSCDTCDGTEANNCLSCKASGSTPWYYSQTKTCTAQCPPGTFTDEDCIKQCSRSSVIVCHPTCETCDGTEENNCLTCQTSGPTPWHYSVDKTCTAQCPPGTFSSDDSLKQCSSCHPTCESCDGTGDHNCLTCKTSGSNLFYNPADKSCNSRCPDGTYLISVVSKRCAPCHKKCATCQDKRNCLSCPVKI